MIAFDRRSLTLRLTLLFGAVSTAVLALIGYAFYTSIGSHFLHEDAITLQGKAELIRHVVARLRSPAEFQPVAERLQDALTGHDDLLITIRRPDGTLLFASAGTLPPPERTTGTGSPMLRIDGMAVDTRELGGNFFRVLQFAVPTRSPDLPEVQVTLALNIDHHREFMAKVRRTVAISVLLGALAAGLLGWVAARIGLAPVHALASLTSRISADQLHSRVVVEQLPSELAELGLSFNAMLSRLEDSFGRLKEFSSDLAHELRTPINALMLQSQVALSRPRTADEYRELLYSALDEYDRLARMISDMLFLAKADNGLLVPSLEPVDLRAEALALFDFYDALVEANEVKLELTGSATIRGDRIMIRRALSNLLSNAISHTPPRSTVTVAMAPIDGERVAVTVSNPGPPISRAHLPRLFDRFYRVDPSRQRSAEGAGLGLAITRSIVAAHGGTIAVTSEGGMTRFEMRLAGSA